MRLNMVECTHCGACYWFPVDEVMEVAGGPCCFGHSIMDVERFPTERDARDVYGFWKQAQARELNKALAAIGEVV